MAAYRGVVVRIGVLGPVTAWEGERELSPGQPRQRAVLGVLAARANRVVSRGELVDAVWGADPPASAEGGIYTYIAGLRRVLEPGRQRRDRGTVLLSEGAGYTLRLGPEDLDAAVFERALARARQLRQEGDMATATAQLDQALGLWRGIAYAGVDGPFADAERQRLTELRTAAAEERADLLIASGRQEEALPDLTVLVAEHPMRERARGLLMVALYRSGRQAEALQAYRDARDALAEELGIDPSSELNRIHQQVLAMDPALGAVPQQPRTAQASPAAGMLPPQAQASIPAQVPLEIAGFTGRQAELKRLNAMVPGASTADTTAMPVAIITGMAGIGKTALAIRFARQAIGAGNFPDGQLYVNLRGFDPSGSPLSPGDVLRGFCDALGVPAKRIPDGIEGQIGLFRSLLDGRRMLVVLDNARTTDQVRPLLPGSPGCMVVITSRSQLNGLVAAEGAKPIRLDVLTPQEAHDMLGGRVGAERLAAEPQAAVEITKFCARLPLALSVISAHAATQPELALTGLSAELRDAQARLDVLDAGEEATTNVRAVFSWSYQQLGADSARMFRLLGTHNGPDISVLAAASLAGVSGDAARTALAELTRASLLTELVPGRFTCHDLLRAYAAEQAAAAESRDELFAAERRLLDHYLRTACEASMRMYPGRRMVSLPDPAPGAVADSFRAYEQALNWLNGELRVLLAAVQAAAGKSGLEVYCWQLPWAIASLLVRTGRWHDFLASQQIAKVAALATGDEVAQMNVFYELGYAYTLLGDSEEARSHLERSIELASRLGDRVAEAEARSGLSQMLERQGHYAEALGHELEALRLRRAYANRAAIAHSENGVGWLYAKLGQFSEALRHCRRAQELNRDSGSRSVGADILDSLGFIYAGLGDHDRSITCYLQALAVYREIGDSHCVVTALTGLGDARQAAGQQEAARDAWNRALAAAQNLPNFDPAELRKRLGGPAAEPGKDGTFPAVTTAR